MGRTEALIGVYEKVTCLYLFCDARTDVAALMFIPICDVLALDGLFPPCHHFIVEAEHVVCQRLFLDPVSNVWNYLT